ncbi:hypothetical protein [Olivibacter jilunii]|uniref:hypothetical protein n=1 Tax=Olivibacter jilunii TaxID=985016 RepID=UPI001030F8CE|nr:hypothetical protein [Olivibacter jilunii]
MFKDKADRKSSQGKSDLASELIAVKILRFQRRWANWMNGKTMKMSRRGQIGALAGLSVVCLSFCFYMVAGNNGNAKALLLNPDYAITVRSPYLLGTSGELMMDSLRLREAYGRIISFRAYMDSLGKTPEGRKTLEHMLSSRPGMVDSLLEAEKLLKQWFK